MGQTVIAEGTLANSSTAGINIASIPTRFQHLKLVYSGRANGAFISSGLFLNINGINTANAYRMFAMEHATIAGGFTTIDGTTAAQFTIGIIPGDTGTAASKGIGT